MDQQNEKNNFSILHSSQLVQIRNVLTLPISLRSSKGVFGSANRKADKEKQISLEVFKITQRIYYYQV